MEGNRHDAILRIGSCINRDRRTKLDSMGLGLLVGRVCGSGVLRFYLDH